jgi:hypothetical protein
MAILDVGYADTSSFPQSFHTSPGVLLLVLDQSETFPHNFAGVLIAPLPHEALHKLSLMLCKNDVARRHARCLEIALNWHIMPWTRATQSASDLPAIQFLDVIYISAYQAVSPQRTISGIGFGGNCASFRKISTGIRSLCSSSSPTRGAICNQ